MKLVLFSHHGGAAVAGALTAGGVVPLPPFDDLKSVIGDFDRLRPELESMLNTSSPIPLTALELLPPLRPGKLLCSTATYSAARTTEPAPLLFTLKSPESVIGPGQTVHLPPVGEAWQFVPEAELGLVIRGPAKSIAASDWRRAVFGFTCVIDVMAQGDTQFGRDFWLAKSDTLGPLGPCVVTLDEIADPTALRVRSFVNGQPAQDFSLADAAYGIGQQLEYATTIMTLHTGDVLACGTSGDGLQPLHDGDAVRVEINGIGALDVHVHAPVGAPA